MWQIVGKEIETINHVYRRTIDKSAKNWKRISFNDFGIKYSQSFQERMKNAKPVRLKLENVTCE